MNLITLLPGFLAAAAEDNNIKETIEEVQNVVSQGNIKLSTIKTIWSMFWPVALRWLGLLLLAIIVFVIGRKIVKFIIKVSKRAMERGKVEASVVNFLCSVIKAVLYAILLVLCANIIGIEATSFVAIFTSIGLAVGLALQGSLSNFAGGVLILILKPFLIGDYIVVNGIEGTVTSIDLFYTRILTIDNKSIVLPNGSLSNSNITNVTHEAKRRLDLIIPIGYNDDIRAVKEELYKVSQRNEHILVNEPVDLFVANFGDDAVEIAFRVWVRKEDYFLVKGELLETIKYMFDEKGFTIPFHQLDVALYSSIADK